jgi:hypothetical protein
MRWCDELPAAVLQQAVTLEPSKGQHWCYYCDATTELGLIQVPFELLSRLKSTRCPNSFRSDGRRHQCNQVLTVLYVGRSRRDTDGAVGDIQA